MLAGIKELRHLKATGCVLSISKQSLDRKDHSSAKDLC